MENTFTGVLEKVGDWYIGLRNYRVQIHKAKLLRKPVKTFVKQSN